MIERIIEGPPRTGLRGSTADAAIEYAREKKLRIAVVTLPDFFDYWLEKIPDAERVSFVEFMRRVPTRKGCLYITEVSSVMEQKIGAHLSECADEVWIMRYVARVKSC